MTNCPHCHEALLPGSRWCPRCRVNLRNPKSGRLAEPAKRLGGHIIDVVLPTVAVIALAVGAGVGAGLTGGTPGTDNQLLLIGAALVIGYFVWCLVLFTRGQSPGKRLLGMRVVTEDGKTVGFLTMLLREWIGKFISSMVFSLGFIWILIDKDRQGFHDKIANTYVVE